MVLLLFAFCGLVDGIGNGSAVKRPTGQRIMEMTRAVPARSSTAGDQGSWSRVRNEHARNTHVGRRRTSRRMP